VRNESASETERFVEFKLNLVSTFSVGTHGNAVSTPLLLRLCMFITVFICILDRYRWIKYLTLINHALNHVNWTPSFLYFLFLDDFPLFSCIPETGQFLKATKESLCLPFFAEKPLACFWPELYRLVYNPSVLSKTLE